MFKFVWVKRFRNPQYTDTQNNTQLEARRYISSVYIKYA